MNFSGLDLTSPLNRIRAGFAAMCVNVRRYLVGGFALRNPLSMPSIPYSNRAVDSTDERCDSARSGVRLHYHIEGRGGKRLERCDEVATGLSVNPVSLQPFQPNQSVQPWMYVGDSAAAGAVTVSGAFTCSGMIKVRSDGVTRKTGIKEPQAPPIVGINTVNVTQRLTPFRATTPPWTNIGGVNANYNYSGMDTQPPYPATISTPIVASTVTLTVTGATGQRNAGNHAVQVPTLKRGVSRRLHCFSCDGGIRVYRRKRKHRCANYRWRTSGSWKCGSIGHADCASRRGATPDRY